MINIIGSEANFARSKSARLRLDIHPERAKKSREAAIPASREILGKLGSRDFEP